MGLRNRLSQPKVLQSVGFAALIVASASRLFLERRAGLQEGAADAITGLLYGIAIGALLMSLWKRGRAARGR